MEHSTVMDEKYYLADLEFHINLANATKNRIHSSFIQAYTTFLQQLIIESSHAEKPIENEFHYHREIFDAVKASDAQLAYKAMQKHLEAASKNKMDGLVNSI